MVNELSLFTGIGGGLLASRLLGWRTICAVEISEYCRGVLGQRQSDGAIPRFPIWDDIRTFDGLPWRGRVDVVSGGFPCQAYSTAARGRNVADDLWPEMRRVVAETAPRYVFAENTSRAAIDAAATDLQEMDYDVVCLPLSAKDLGGDHIRPRYWLRAHAHDEGKLRGELNAEVASVPSLREGVWDAFPGGSRVFDGLAHRMDRFEASGNGQVAIVAATAWHLMRGAQTVGEEHGL